MRFVWNTYYEESLASPPNLPETLYPDAPPLGVSNMGLAGYTSAESEAELRAAMEELKEQIDDVAFHGSPFTGRCCLK